MENGSGAVSVAVGVYQAAVPFSVEGLVRRV